MPKLPEIQATQTQAAAFAAELDEDQIGQVLQEWFVRHIQGAEALSKPPLYDVNIFPSDVAVRISGGGGSLVSASLSLDVKAEVSDG